MPLGTFSTFVRPTVTIVRPMPSSYRRGIPNKPIPRDKQLMRFSVRMSDDNELAIRQAAAALDMDKTAFVRWCAVNVADEILKQKAEYDKQP